MMSQYLHQQWSQFWQDSNLKQYVGRQVEQASLTFYRMTKHYLYFTYILKVNHEQIQIQQINVLIVLGKGFPVSPPQIHFMNSFTKPSLKDHRDILVELIGQSWDWNIKLVNVLHQFPRLISKLISLNGNPNAFQKIGQFHPHKYYDYSMVKQLSQHDPFICFDTQQEQITILVVSITCTHIIFFKPVAQPFFSEENKLVIPRENELGEMRIVLVGDLQSLNEIVHDRKHKNEYTLRFTAFYLKKMEYIKHECRKKLNITRSNRFMESLIKEMSHFGIKIAIQTAITPNSNEEILLAEASRCQQKLKHYFNRESLMELIDAYQRVVQFYSADGPPYQQIYVHKTMSLYSRADVELILKAHSNI